MTNLKKGELPIFIPFTSDYGFKVTFGNEENTLFLQRAIPALTQSSKPITKIVFDKTVYSGLTESGKSGIFDLACTDDSGDNFIIEMEVRAKPDFLQRLKFYAILRFNTYIKKGKHRYDNLPKQYCIGFLGRNIFSLPHYHNLLSFKNQDGIEVDDQMTLITIELPKFNVKEKDVITDLEKLIFTIKNAKKMVKLPKNKRPLFMQEDWLDSALHELDTRNFSPEKYEAYMRYMVRQADIQRQEEEAAKRNQQQGMLKGRREGKIEGKIEEKIELITKMIFSNKMSIQEMADFFSVDQDFIEAIKSKLTI